MRLLTLLLLLCAGLLAGAAPRLFVVNALSHDISIIDMEADTVVGRIALGAQAYHLAFAGRTGYVTATAGTGQLLAVEPTGRITARLDLGLAPLATVHASPDGKFAYVVTAGPPGSRNTVRGSVLTVDLASFRLLRRVNVGLNPLDSALAPDGRTLYTADWASRTVSVVDVARNRLSDSIPLGFNTARTLALRPDGKKLYVAVEPQAQLIARNGNGLMNDAMSNVSQSANQQLTQQQGIAVETQRLWEIDTASNAVSKSTIPAVSPVLALAVSPDGAQLFLYGRTGPQPTYTLVSIDLKTKKVLRDYGNFGYCAALVFHPAGGKLYLVGTPGDPAQESRARNAFQQRAKTDGAANAGAVNDLRDVAKTVTVLDLAKPQVRKVLTVGSLPEGAAVRK
jgi:YVTN family beta-propeller protein